MIRVAGALMLGAGLALVATASARDILDRDQSARLPMLEIVYAHVDPNLSETTGLDVLTSSAAKPFVLTRRSKSEYYDPMWSPDGHYVAFLRGGSRSGLYVVRADGPRVAEAGSRGGPLLDGSTHQRMALVAEW